ncbi:hypothetical protein CEE45_11995 [Candidatus Heimdallarchaeota archaeon B3_Heim]|nr:MAG: hypothetical protein CEE45_11995 [Candidatus Heimdallarchaeota archaeon B3_Heim]
MYFDYRFVQYDIKPCYVVFKIDTIYFNLSTQAFIDHLKRKTSILSESKRLAVLGVGNSIRMDDGAGIQVIESF